ncbi:hypothetical protein AHAS_Ahas15G0221900 [Arachis hypogaea]
MVTVAASSPPSRRSCRHVLSRCHHRCPVARPPSSLREIEVEWREVEGELFVLPFTPPLLSHSGATAESHCCASPSKVESHDGAPFVLLWSAERGAHGWRKAS